MLCVVSKSIDLFAQIRQRKYFNLCWFIWESGPAPAAGGDETQQVPKINTEMEMSRHIGNTTCISDCIWDGGWIILPHLDLSVRTTGEGRAFCESREEVITGWLLSSRHIFGLRVSVVTIMDYWPLIGSGVTRLVSHWLMRGCVGAGGRINRALSHKGRPGHMTHSHQPQPKCHSPPIIIIVHLPKCIIQLIFLDKWHNGHGSTFFVKWWCLKTFIHYVCRDKMYCVFWWRIHVFVSALQYWGLGCCRLQRGLQGQLQSSCPAVTTLGQTLLLSARPASAVYSCTAKYTVQLYTALALDWTTPHPFKFALLCRVNRYFILQG